MSALLPVAPSQVELWSRPRPEPVVLALPDWTLERVIEPDATFPNQRWMVWRRDDSTVELMRCWDLPRSPGYPMQVASTRTVVAGGHGFEVATTSLFEGTTRSCDVCWLRGEGHQVRYLVRLVLDRCTAARVADVLARVDVRW